MLIDKEVKITWGMRNKKFYEEKGYVFTGVGDEFLVKTEDLSKGNHVLVKIKCDYCGELYNSTYARHIINKESDVPKDSCVKCKHLKTEELSILKYGNKSKRFTNQEIVNAFKSVNLILLNVEDYENAQTKMECLCEKHPEEIISISYNAVQSKKQGCKFCSWDKLSSDRRKFTFKEVEDIFKQRNFTLLSDSYKTVKQLMRYKCNKHPEEIYETIFENVLLGGGCKVCRYEKNTGENNSMWKGGISPLKKYLRSKIIEWKNKTMEKCGFKCVITGERFDDIHHLCSFNLIFEETLENLQIDLRDVINDYTEVELKLLEEECLKLHEKYPLGVCLTEEIHREFHLIYGYGNNTPEQFEEFKKNKLNNIKEVVA